MKSIFSITGGLTAIALVLSVNYVRVGPSDIYPPVGGAINTEITQENINETVCNPNWTTKSIRPSSYYTNKLKKEQMEQLGLQGEMKDYEEDHLISLVLGGHPTSTYNLWPQPYKASIPDGGARNKDKVENFLHSRLCNGDITLEEAQHVIVKDWYKVYQGMVKKGVDKNVSDIDPDEK